MNYENEKITKENIKTIIYDDLQLLLSNYKEYINVEEFMEEFINYIYELVNNKDYSSDELINIVNNELYKKLIIEYSKRYFKKDTNIYSNTLKLRSKIIYIEKLFADFFNKTDYLDVINELLKIDKLNEVIKIIYDNEKERIIAKPLSVLYSSKFLCDLIEKYCDINNLKYNNLDSYEYYSLKESDNIFISDPLRSYMREISKIPLLTLEEEEILGNRILEGDKEAVKELARRNLRLVTSIVKRIKKSDDIEFMDLIEEGNISLLRAAELFDIKKGYKFSTYANWIVSRDLIDYCESHTKNYRIPPTFFRAILNYKKGKNELFEILGREATRDELIDYLKIDSKKILDYEEASLDPVSLESEFSNIDSHSDGAALLQDFIEDKRAGVEDIVILNDLKERINQALDKNLTEKEKNVVILRNGLIDGIPRTMVDVGKMLNISHEGVRITEKRAYKKLYLTQTGYHLSEFLDYDFDNSNIPSKNKKSSVKLSKHNKTNIDKLLKKGSKCTKRLMSIYERYNEYGEREIDQVLDTLTDDEVKLMNIRYGDNWHNPKPTSEYNERIKEEFYSTLIPKIDNLLVKKKKKTKSFL